MSSQFSMEEVPLNQIFQKAVVLQRSGDRDGALDQYKQFLKVAESHDVDPLLYVSLLWLCLYFCTICMFTLYSYYSISSEHIKCVYYQIDT